jgi:hypothetical protein
MLTNPMACPQCYQAQTRALRNAPWGGYHLACVPCCVRLVLSARPLRGQQDTLLAAITRGSGSLSRTEILAAIKRHGAG